MKTNERLFGWADGVIVGVLLLLCAALFLVPHLRRSRPLTAEVIADGAVVQTVDLSKLTEPQTRTVGGCEIVFSRDGVRFSAADCPDRLCVKTGVIRFAGESIACVPNRVVVTLRRQGGAPYDVVAY